MEKLLITHRRKTIFSKLNKIANKTKRFLIFIKLKYLPNSDKYFYFNKRKFKYYIAMYNNTFLNERIIEIPIVLDYIKQNKNKDILEIGNVISHYKNVRYDVVDKYENRENVINKDAIEYKPSKRYDLIVSISTFEHIGFDETTRYGDDKEVILQQSSLMDALKNTKSLLKKNGVFIFTAPLGFNNFLDAQLIDNKLELTEAFYFLRTSSNNRWLQVKHKDVIGVKYNNPYKNANALLIGIYKKG